MQKLPASKDTLVVRTDFSDEDAWKAICLEIEKPVGDFQACVRFISNPSFNEATEEQLAKAGAESGHRFLLVVDRDAIKNPERGVLAIDLLERPGCSLRFTPSVAWSVENNLSLANMDFSESVEAVGEDRVFRGF